MDPFVAFFIEHWILSSTFIVILLLFLANEWRHRTFGLPRVSHTQLVDLLNHSHATVVDVRSHELFEQGHILHAINLPQAQIVEKLNSLNKYKAKPVILVCGQGLDSPKVGQVLIKQGFTQLYCLTGGMGAWLSNGMPVVKK